MKSFVSNIIARVTVIAMTVAAALGATAQTYTITMVDNSVHTYEQSALDSIQFVGGNFGSTTGVGVKVYPKNNGGHSVEYLYSQISSLVITGGTVTVNAPTISPNGGSYTAAQSVTVSTTTSGATVYYTTDGSVPSASNYAGRGSTTVTFTLNSSATVKAVAIYNGIASAVTTASFTITTASDNNANRNSNIAGWASLFKKNNNSNAGIDSNWQPWRLEFPRLKTGASNSWSVQYTTGDGLDDPICYSLEWDNNKLATRWVCYQFNPCNIVDNNVGRNESWAEDNNLPSGTRSKQSDYSSSGFSRGHLCMSNDRQVSKAQNQLTFKYSNMAPQYSNHNSGQWQQLENDVQSWAKMSKCDTLYVVKAATIDDVTLNNSTSSGLLNVTCNNRLPVSKYFYMALLAYNKSQDKYYAMGIWTYHYNATNQKQSAQYITIDELEARTNIDFFCNLPDDIESQVEATLDTSYWTTGASLNR